MYWQPVALIGSLIEAVATWLNWQQKPGLVHSNVCHLPVFPFHFRTLSMGSLLDGYVR